MLGHKGDELGPGQEQGDGGQVLLQVEADVGGQEDGDEEEQDGLQPVLQGEEVAAQGHGHLEDLPGHEAGQEDGEGWVERWLAQVDDEPETGQEGGLQPVGEDEAEAGLAGAGPGGLTYYYPPDPRKTPGEKKRSGE